jgi:hypothetical protein
LMADIGDGDTEILCLMIIPIVAAPTGLPMGLTVPVPVPDSCTSRLCARVISRVTNRQKPVRKRQHAGDFIANGCFS